MEEMNDLEQKQPDWKELAGTAEPAEAEDKESKVARWVLRIISYLVIAAMAVAFAGSIPCNL